MPKYTLATLGSMLRQRRGKRGLREVAREIDVSVPTLSRMERGHLPDLETFGKVCRWLEIDPGEVLGLKMQKKHTIASVHFRKDHAIKPETAQALAKLILGAQLALMAMEE